MPIGSGLHQASPTQEETHSAEFITCRMPLREGQLNREQTPPKSPETSARLHTNHGGHRDHGGS